MLIKGNIEIEQEAIKKNVKRLVNQIYKLLPSREEGSDWRKPLETIIEEIAGMNILLVGKQDIVFSLLCKLEGLTLLVQEEDFALFRRTIFECLGLLGKIEEQCLDSQD